MRHFDIGFLLFKLLLHEGYSNYCKRVSFLCKFCAFLEHPLTFQVTVSRFRSSFFSDLYCCEVKRVANIKLVAE